MKKFISQVVKFALTGSIALVILIYLTNYLVRKNASFKIPANVDNIVLGNSEPECAFDDSLILNFANFAESGESYFYTYFKAIELLEQNKQIKIVFLEISNVRMNKKLDNHIWGEEYMINNYPIYGPFLDTKANKLLWSNNFRDFLKSVGRSIRSSLFFTISPDHDYTKKIGGYAHLETNNENSMRASMDEIKDSEFSNNNEISEYTVDYLQKIINEGNAKNIKVYLIRTPMHPKYPGSDEKYFQTILSSKFSNIEFLDFKDFPLENSDYFDLVHLNFHGAEKFSLFFNELLKNGLLEKSNKQEFINNEMK